MTTRLVSGTTLTAVLVALLAALIGRAWLQVQLLQDGMSPGLAADLSYLFVVPVLVFLLFPLWRSQKPFLRDQLRRFDLTWRVAMRAFAIGLLLRLLWWAQVMAGASFGIYRSNDPDAIVGPVFSFQCAAPQNVILSFLVMAIMVPLIEEVIHRGYVMTALRHRGFIVSVLVSALVFMILHGFASWPFSFVGGLVFGLQYWATQSLWSSLISHATVNGLIQIDWRCLSFQWNPQTDVPLMMPGLLATAAFVAGLVALLYLLRQTAAEAHKVPR